MVPLILFIFICTELNSEHSGFFLVLLGMRMYELSCDGNFFSLVWSFVELQSGPKAVNIVDDAHYINNYSTPTLWVFLFPICSCYSNLSSKQTKKNERGTNLLQFTETRTSLFFCFHIVCVCRHHLKSDDIELYQLWPWLHKFPSPHTHNRTLCIVFI